MGYDGFQFALSQELPFLTVGANMELRERVTDKKPNYFFIPPKFAFSLKLNFLVFPRLAFYLCAFCVNLSKSFRCYKLFLYLCHRLWNGDLSFLSFYAFRFSFVTHKRNGGSYEVAVCRQDFLSTRMQTALHCQLQDVYTSATSGIPQGPTDNWWYW